MVVRNRVRAVRERRGFTQEQLGHRVGLARQSIISIEKGRFLPTIDTALRLSHALGVPIGKVFWLEDKREEKLVDTT
ncbi:MAG: helix-turn-helix transcriptional regulator [Acidobacteriota bacterium]